MYSFLFGLHVALKIRSLINVTTLLLGCLSETVQLSVLFTLQIPDSLGDKFSHCDSQNETQITHYENVNQAKCFFF